MTEKPGPLPVPMSPMDFGTLMAGPFTALRLFADLGRTTASAMPAGLLIAASPFFWAPPLWVGMLMAAGGMTGMGNVAGSTVTPSEAARTPGNTVRPAAPPPPPVAPEPATPKPARPRKAPARRPSAGA